MSVSLEQPGYVGKTEVPKMETSSTDKFSQIRNNSSGLNLKATELRLGLPGSESPERDTSVVVEDKNGYPLCMLKSLVSGAKRGFSDAIDGGSGKWILSVNGGSEVGMCKDGGLFSPRGGVAGNDCINQQVSSVVKDKIPQSPNLLNEKKKPQISAPAAKYHHNPLLSLFFFSLLLLFLFSLLLFGNF